MTFLDRPTSALRSTPTRTAAASIIAVLLTLTCIVAGGPPAAAQSEGNGLSERSVNTFLFDASRGIVRVNIDITLTNVTTDQRDGNVIRQRYFDGYFAAIPLGAENVVATRNGSELSGEITNDPEFPAFSYYNFPLGRRLFSGQSTTINITYDHFGAGPRNDVPWRVNAAYASFVAFGIGDDEQVTIKIVRPAGYEFDDFTELDGYEASEPDGFGSVTFTREGVNEDFRTIVGMSNDGRLLETPLDVDGVDIELRSWPDDPEWLEFARERIESGIPALEALIGSPWPVDEPFEVKQTIEPYLYGYAGWFDSNANEIAVGEQLDADTMYHELSHAWFNNETFLDRWLVEGFAQIYAAELVSADGDIPIEPGSLPSSHPGFQELTGWTSFSTDDEEDYGYEMSHYVMDAIADDIGFDGLAEVLAALDGQRSAYEPSPGAEPSANNIANWRRLLDLFELVGGSDQVTELYADHVLAGFEASELDRRSTAQTDFAAVRDRAADWTLPLPIRQSMDTWNFLKADRLIGLANETLDLRDDVDELATTTGVAPPDVASALFTDADRDYDDANDALETQIASGEALVDDQDEIALRAADLELSPPPVSAAVFDVADFAAGSVVIADQLDALTAVEAAMASAAISPSFVESIGLRGTDVDAVVDQARAAIDSGDNDLARERAADAIAQRDAAEASGTRQLTIAAVIAAAVFFVLAIVLWRWRRRRRQRAAEQSSSSGLTSGAERIGVDSVGLDEDALAGALLGGVDDRVDVSGRDLSEAAGAARVVEREAGLGDVSDPVLELDEDVVAVVDANTVSGAEVLIDPDTHDGEGP